MKIVWIVPYKRKCGITLYAEKYAKALSAHCTLVVCDPAEFIENRAGFREKIAGCDLAHIQYEPLFFRQGRRDFYPAMCDAIHCKKVVTLHEVYSKPPGVFPREDITGIGPLKMVKTFLWDKNHPHWAAFGMHVKRCFFSDAILVHAMFHKQILVEKGVDDDRIHIIPLPAKVPSGAAPERVKKEKKVTFGATGFINPLFDYDLLLAVLSRLTIEWSFIWIGGVRRDDDAGLLRFLEWEIDKRGWRGRFTITGKVFYEERDRLFQEVDVFCALFKDRSNSESLMDAIAAKKLIVATRIPLTQELASQGPVCILVERDPVAIANRIGGLLSDGALQTNCRRACGDYAERFSYERCALQVVNLYKRLISE
jgi:glycosyltransferase involved in cell wall biosynthesis